MTLMWPTVEVASVCLLIVECVNKTAPIVAGPTQHRMIPTTNVHNGRVVLDRLAKLFDVTWTVEPAFDIRASAINHE
jgi:type I restriction enzyme, S subunit